MQGAADVASSAGGRCRERQNLPQARAPVGRSDRSWVEGGRSLQGAADLASSAGARFRAKKSCKTTNFFCVQRVDAVELTAAAKKVLSTPPILSDLYSMSRNKTGE